MRQILSIFLVSTLLLFPNQADAHEPNHSYIFLKIYESQIIGRLEIQALDLNRELQLGMQEELLKTELKASASEIRAYLSSVLSFTAGAQSYDLAFTEVSALKLDDEADNVVIHFELSGLSKIPDNLTINYNAFFEKKSDHRGVLIIEHNWKAGIINNHLEVADIFTRNDVSKTLDLTDDSSWNGFVAMVKLGMWHIWIGLDHILFLVALILPAVVRRRHSGLKVELIENGNTNWLPVAKFKPAFIYILGIVTSFTIAHSITLAIAALGIIDIPSKYVESIIAFSIALAAFHNIRPIFKAREWVIAFAFGLFHGFGFASVLGEKGLAGEFISLSLLGFNVGVEIGQVLIVAGIFPLLFLLRKLKAYPKLLTYGSVLLIIISFHWVVERLFEIDIRLGRILDSIL
ncbi:HupE/UreJ family protein [Roseivirga sp.]|uniref:HupE/UreJ family protein n=1 Tax=Roseivirga sp. TaxID=1964215 RepID=UPI003B8EA52C